MNKMAPDKASPQASRYLALAACMGMTVAGLIVLHHLLPPASAWPQGWSNSFDAGIVTHVNQATNRWPWLKAATPSFVERPLLKAGPIVLLFWIAFFQTGNASDKLERRRILAATVPLALFGAVLARILAAVLPFRQIPLLTVALHFQLPQGLHPYVAYGLSSFPSAHAVLFVALSVGLLIASPLLGSLSLVYTFGVILFFRVYLGLHWPTDLLAGAAIGASLASIVTIKTYRNFVWRLVTRCWQRWPGTSAAFIMLLSYEIMDEITLAVVKTLLKHLL